MRSLPTCLLPIFVTLLATGASAQRLYVERGPSIRALPTSIRAAAGHRSSETIAISAADRSMKLVGARTLETRATIENLDAPVSCLSFSRDGTVILSGLASGQLVMWDVKTAKALQQLWPHSTGIVGAGLTPQGFALTASLDRVLKVTDTLSRNTLATSARVPEHFTALFLHPTERSAIVVTAGGFVYVHTLPQLAEARRFDTRAHVNAAAISTDGKVLVLGGVDGLVRLWDLAAGVQRSAFPRLHGSIVATAIDPEGKWIVAAASDSTVRVFDVENQGEVYKEVLDDGPCTVVQFLDEETLWAGTIKGGIHTWKVRASPPDTLPPVITLLAPVEDQPTRVYAPEIEVRGFVEDASPLARLTVGGKPVSPKRGEPLESGLVRTPFTVSVSLDTVGWNTVEVRAADERGNISEKSIRVQRLSGDQVVELLSPGPNAETERVSIKLEFRVWSPLASYQVFVNLLEMVDVKDAGGKAIGEINVVEVPLVVGYNQIQIVITSTTGEKFTRTLGVSRKMLGGVAVTPSGKLVPKERAPGPQRWAVVVGISEYEHRAIPALKYADRDAEAFAEFLQRPEGGGFEPDHMRILINNEATLANIKEALIDFLSHAIDRDLVMIYFAGHGAPEPARPTNLYLLAYDTDPSRLGTTAYPMWQLQDVFSRYLTAKKIVVFSDACHSGGISVDFAARGLAVTESNLINQYLADLARAKEGIVVFTASAAGEVSQEFPELGHGVFTYYLLEGMKGAADYNNDYTVTINELMQYVEEQVKRKTKGAQNPTRSQTAYDKDLTISVLAH